VFPAKYALILDNPGYPDIQANSATAYCYIYRSFIGSSEGGVQYVPDVEEWSDYKFAIITTTSIGQTGVFRIQNGANRPGWVDATVPNPDDPTRPPVSYVALAFRSRTFQFLPCDISSNDAYFIGG
jgi:hypothetical protein